MQREYLKMIIIPYNQEYFIYIIYNQLFTYMVILKNDQDHPLIYLASSYILTPCWNNIELINYFF